MTRPGDHRGDAGFTQGSEGFVLLVVVDAQQPGGTDAAEMGFWGGDQVVGGDAGGGGGGQGRVAQQTIGLMS